jgi:hypothetical protein
MVLQIAGKLLGPLMPIVSRLSSNGHYRTTAQSATDVLNAAFDTKTLGERPNGIYMNGGMLGDVGPEAKDAAKCEKLWKDSLIYANVQEGDTVLAAWR